MTDNVRTLAAAMLLILASCGNNGKGKEPEPPVPAPTPTAEDLETAQQAFFELMESNDFHNEALISDMQDRRKSNKDIRKRLDRIKSNMERARALRTRAEAKKQKELGDEFDLFLKDLADVRAGDWLANGKTLWNRIQDSCSRCHDRFEEDE